METSNVTAPKFPLVLIDDELNEFIDKHGLTQIEEDGDVILFDRTKPLVHYAKGCYEDATVYKRLQTA